jgi:electron transfer flavoprotein beta subunit
MKIEGNQVVATRKIGDCTEVVTASFPVVLTVLPEINKPRIPSLKQVLGAAKKPVTEWKAADLDLDAAALAPKYKVKAVQGFVMSRKNVLYKEGTPAEKVAALVAGLTKEGVL